MHTFGSNTFGRFLVVGVGNTVLGLAVIFTAAQAYSPFIANAIGYLIVVPVSFMTHRQMSFRHKGQRLPAFLKYLLVIGAGYLSNLFVLSVLTEGRFNPYLTQACAISTHVLVTYYLSRIIVFKEAECD